MNMSVCYTYDSTLELTTRFVEESLGEQTILCEFSELNGVLRITIEQNTLSFQMGGPQSRVQLHGTMVDIK